MKETLRQEVKSLAFYILILVVFLQLVNTKTSDLKHQINTAVRFQCQSGASAATIRKYNDVVNVLIHANQQSKNLNLKASEGARAAINSATAARLQADLIAVPHVDCSKPLLP